MANSFAEAFEKSGIVSKGTVADIERQKKRKEAEEKERIESENKRFHEKVMNYNKEQEKKFKPFDDLWNNEKSQKFMKHIINSFLLFDKAQFVWDFSQDQEKKCFVCGTPLISKNEIMISFMEHNKEFLDNVRKEITGEIKNSAEENAKLVAGDKVLAVGSEESKKCFCPDCAQNFSEWVMNKMMVDTKFGGYLTYVRKKQMEELKNKTVNS